MFPRTSERKARIEGSSCRFGSPGTAMAVRYAHLFASRQEHLTGRIEAVFRRAEAEKAFRRDDLLMTSTPTGTGGQK